MSDKIEIKTITITLEEFDLIVDALKHTQHIRYLNDDAKKEYKELLIKLDGNDYFVQ
ncbi:hypothetical protein AAHB47_01345 [Bacillus wiedmannii]